VIFSNPAECVLCWLAVCSPVCYQIAVVKFSSTTFYLNYRYDVKKLCCHIHCTDCYFHVQGEVCSWLVVWWLFKVSWEHWKYSTGKPSRCLTEFHI